MRSALLILVAAVCVLTVIGTAAAQDEGKVEQGAVLYKQYCAACHGLNGKGNGPAAPAMKNEPADLTMLQKKGEEFPFFRVRTVVDGELDVTAHGSRDMPIWGEYFRATGGEGRELVNVNNLANFLKSIQRFKE